MVEDGISGLPDGYAVNVDFIQKYYFYWLTLYLNKSAWN
jgi:hypothetical protein